MFIIKRFVISVCFKITAVVSLTAIILNFTSTSTTFDYYPCRIVGFKVSTIAISKRFGIDGHLLA